MAQIHGLLDSRGVDLSGFRLGLYRQVELTLVLLRQNISQMVAAEMFDVSQPTVSRVYRRVIALLDRVLSLTSIDLEDALAQRHLLLVDSTPVPTGNRPASGQERDNYSGKHHRQCVSVMVACTTRGQLIATSAPAPGSRHDSKALELVGWKDLLDHDHVAWVADTAFVATTALTPIKKARGRDRLDWERQFNKEVASLRAPSSSAWQ